MGQTATKAEELKEVTLTGVVATGQELGRGAYGRVFKVQYCKKEYAAKEIHPLLIDDRSDEDKKAIEDKFVKECLCCKKIKHQNIVGFKGVYFDSKDSIYQKALSVIFGSKQPTSPPIMVMELMETSLKLFIAENKSNIKKKTKMSILCDVSEGLNFLHTSKPAIIHRDLSSNNIMMTSELVAKIGDLGVARVLSADSTESRSTLTRIPGTPHFMPPEALEEFPKYGTPVDVFSFSAIALHVFSEEWPTPSAPKRRNPTTDELVACSEADRRQKYFKKMIGNLVKLKKLMKRCLDDNPKKRPSMEEVTQKLKIQRRRMFTKLKKVGAKSKNTNKSKPKSRAQHPKYSDMIIDAITFTKEQGGCSTQKILKYINANYKVGDRYEFYVRLALRRMLENGILVQTKSCGSFKLTEKVVGKKKSSNGNPTK